MVFGVFGYYLLKFRSIVFGGFFDKGFRVFFCEDGGRADGFGAVVFECCCVIGFVGGYGLFVLF